MYFIFNNLIKATVYYSFFPCSNLEVLKPSLHVCYLECFFVTFQLCRIKKKRILSFHFKIPLIIICVQVL